MKIGITGKNGFVGKHLYNTLGLFPEEYERIDFCREYFDDDQALDRFVSTCDVIVHMAALNRHDNEKILYEKNVLLVSKLIAALERTGSAPHVIMSSSIQEDRDNLYGKSKQVGRDLFAEWSLKTGATFTGLLIPNVFGAFGKPYYNSFIATFCHQLIHQEQPTIARDSEVHLIYVQELVDEILSIIKLKRNCPKLVIQHTATKKVSVVLELLQNYVKSYVYEGHIPEFFDRFDLNLFNTFRSYMDHNSIYPRMFQQHEDQRGSFVELIRSKTGGQSSYSTTVPTVTRGNHLHTRKIERFAVVSGQALIQLRRIDSDEVMNFYLDGTKPSYVDMPIWYTHNIKNIGEGELITMFWINEAYNPSDPDTYFLEV